MLTVQKRTFAQLIDSGYNQKEAAIAAGYAERSAHVKGSQLMRDPEVIKYLDKLKQSRTTVADKINAQPDASAYKFKTGEDFLRHIMNDEMAEDKIRTEAAKALYAVEKGNGKGIKAARQAKGEQIANISTAFTALAAPTSSRKLN